MYKYKEAINILINRFSELREVYEKNVSDYEGLPYVFYESVFLKYILDIATNRDDDKLRKIFLLIEDILSSGDEEIKNLIGVSIVESLYYEKETKSKKVLENYFGEITKKSYEDCF